MRTRSNRSELEPRHDPPRPRGRVHRASGDPAETVRQGPSAVIEQRIGTIGLVHVGAVEHVERFGEDRVSEE